MSNARFGDVPAEQKVQMSLVVRDPPAHTALVSIVQVLEQPSPLFVFPSSQASDVCSKPSPQLTTQVSLAAFGDRPPLQGVHVSGEVVVPPVQT